MRLVLPALLALAAAGPAHAQTSAPAAPEGDWTGSAAVKAGLSLPLVLHLRPGSATVDSPDQNALGLAATLTPAPGGVALDLPSVGAHLVMHLSADGSSLDGSLIQGGAELPVHFSRLAPGATAGPDRPQTPRPPFPYTVEEVRFPGGAPGLTLAGTLTRPPGAAPVPAVVLIAGSGPQNRDEVVVGHRIFLLLADRLTRAGVAVLRYDKRGVGESGRVGASPVLDDYAADARAAVAFLRTRRDVRADRVGLLGHSEGAEVAPMAAAGDARIAFLVLLGAPAVTGDVGLAAQIRAMDLASGATPDQAQAAADLEGRVLRTAAAAPDAAAAQAQVEAMLLAAGLPKDKAEASAREVGSPWLRAFVRHDPADDLAKLRMPVLALYGGLDLQVPPSTNAAPMRRALARDKAAEVRELPGLNHLLQPATLGLPAEYGRTPTTMDEGALRLITGWTAAHAR